MNVLTGLNSTVSALDAEQLRMDIVSQNIANINTTRTADGTPYQRKQVIFTVEMNKAQGGKGGDQASGVTTQVVNDPSPAQMIFNPKHPHADGSGMVAMPNISVAEEMVDMITASRSFEANLSAVKIAKSMAQKTISIGK